MIVATEIISMYWEKVNQNNKKKKQKNESTQDLAYEAYNYLINNKLKYSLFISIKKLGILDLQHVSYVNPGQ